MSQFENYKIESPHFMILPENKFKSPSNQNYRVTLSGLIDFGKNFYIGSTWNINNINIRDYNMSMDKVVNRVKFELPPFPNQIDNFEYKFVPTQWTIQASPSAIWKMDSSRFGGVITGGWKLEKSERIDYTTQNPVNVFKGIEINLEIIYSQMLRVGYYLDMYGYFVTVLIAPLD